MDFTKMSEEDLLADSGDSSSSSEDEGEHGGVGSAGSKVPRGNKVANSGGQSIVGIGKEDIHHHHPIIPAVEVGDSSSADDGDSSSEDDAASEEDEGMDVDEDTLLAELNDVKDKLAEQPYSYDLYLDKIRILKALGDLDQLRACREKMSSLYPLSPALWVDWIKDEQKMISSDEEKERVFSLLERAVKDYSSVEIWIEYINFCLSNMQDPSGVERCREVFEKALGNVGLNVAMGSLIWDTYRDFEAAMLASQPTEELQAAQEKRYVSLCCRQLTIPLLDMENTYSKIKGKIEDIDERTQAAYKKAKERLGELQEWEAKLVQTSEDSKKLQIYRDYIELEKKAKSNPVRIQCLYERALTDIPLDSSLWIEYIDYLSKNLKVPELILEVTERATRNCTWILSVWMKYMWVVEVFFPSMNVHDGNNNAVLDKMKAVFENAIVYCGGTVDGAGTLWLKYLEFLKRLVGVKNALVSKPPEESSKDSMPENPEKEKELAILRKTFFAAETHLLQLIEAEPNEYIAQVLMFRARFEALKAGTMTQEVRSLWKDIFRRGYATTHRVFNQYIMQEITYGMDPKKIRNELSKAMTTVRDDPQSVADTWLNFERDYGDLNMLAAAETKISKELEKPAVSSYPTNYDVPVTNYANNNNNQNYGKDFSRGREKGGRKRQFEDVKGASKISPKKGRFAVEDAVDGDRGGGGFKVPEVPKVKNRKDNGPASDTKAQLNAVPPPRAPVKHDSSKDSRTVFVSNLDFSSDEAAIKEFFVPAGEVEETRLVRDFKGRSKGFGYVVFTEDSCVQAALEMDRKQLGKRPVFVSKCDPDKSTRQPQFKYAQSLEKNKLFVKGLPFELTDKELREMFEAFGPLKDCRLVTYRNGHSKGIAYVEFEKAANASAAILKMDGTTIKDKVISVAISNPPSKNQPQSLEFVSSRTEPDQRRGRNVFVPRVVQAASGASRRAAVPKSSVKQEEAATNSSQPSSSGGKSNDDFRKMFMKS